MKQLKEKEYEEFQQYLYNKAHGYIWTPDTLELICGGNDNELERIGRQMLELLIWQGYERASLAVQKANYAVKMYENVGFKIVDENAEEYIMVCEL